jgi:hypothetical protein
MCTARKTVNVKPAQQTIAKFRATGRVTNAVPKALASLGIWAAQEPARDTGTRNFPSAVQITNIFCGKGMRRDGRSDAVTPR